MVTIRYTIATFGDTINGCANSRCQNTCPEWPEDDNRHCGTDVVTQADFYGDTTARQSIVIEGGIIVWYHKPSGTYAIRTLTNSQIYEYQYTHITDTLANHYPDPRGEYIHPGIQLGNYSDEIGYTTRAHVHAVIVLYFGNIGTIDLTQATTSLSPYYQSVGIPDQFPPTPTPTPTDTP